MNTQTDLMCPGPRSSEHRATSENVAQPHTKKNTQRLLEALQAEGVKQFFMLPGGTLDPIMQEFSQHDYAITPIVAAHEAGAGFMADGYARASGKFGVCAAIGTAGAANLVPALATAYADESPILALIGQLQTSLTGSGAFQDGSAAGLHDLSYLAPLCRYAQEVPNAALLDQRLHSAIREMKGDRRGPACLTLPVEVQIAEQNGDYVATDPNALNPPSVINCQQAERCAKALQAAKKIVILAGSGASKIYVDEQGEGHYRGAEALRKFAELYELPVATTLKGKGVFPEDHRLSLGIFGYAGTPQAHYALLEAKPDVILAVGTSLNQRNTMKWDKRLSQATIIHVDSSRSAFDRFYPSDIKVQADAATFFEYLSDVADVNKRPNTDFDDRLKASVWLRRMWLNQIKQKPRLYAPVVYAPVVNEETLVHPSLAVKSLQQVAPSDTVALVDSGAHRVFMAHYWQSNRPNSYLTATATAPMGWAIPAGIGAQLARPTRPHLVVTGDGCALMHGVELHTAVRHQIPLVIVIFNNSALGNVYLRAQKMGDKSRDITRLPTHNWAAFAESLGAKGRVVQHAEELLPAFNEAFQHSDGPFVVDVRCDNVNTPIGPWNAPSTVLHD